jgi:hypothetical protein
MRSFAAGLVFAMGLAIMPAHATVTFVTSRAALGANDAVDWAQLGPAGSLVSTPAFAQSTGGGVTVDASTPAGEVLRHDQGVDWVGNFAPGQALLVDQFELEPLQLTFSQPVLGAGAQIQESLLRSFIGSLSVVGAGNQFLGSVSIPGLANAAADGSAIFLGVLSDTPFTRVRFDTVGPNGAVDSGFAINALALVEAPEPPSALLLAGALAALLARRLRPRARVSAAPA